MIGQAKKALEKGDDALLNRILTSMEKLEDSKKTTKNDEINPLKNYKKAKPLDQVSEDSPNIGIAT